MESHTGRADSKSQQPHPADKREAMCILSDRKSECELLLTAINIEFHHVQYAGGSYKLQVYTTTTAGHGIQWSLTTKHSKHQRDNVYNKHRIRQEPTHKKNQPP